MADQIMTDNDLIRPLSEEHAERWRTEVAALLDAAESQD